MAQIQRQETVLHILQNLRDLAGLKKLFWEELNYERENRPLSMRGWPDSTRNALVDDPILFASGGTDNAFHVVYCRLASDSLQRGLERPIVNQLIREHPYCLFVFSDSAQSAWHFLNVEYDEKTEKRRLLRRITVQAGSGLRTAAERLQMMDLALMGKDLFGIPTLEIQKRHDDAFDVESVTKAFYKELANWYFWARDHAVFPKDAPVDADGKPSLSLIRLITRLIFCWFLREKRNPQTGEGLLPEALFDQRHIQKLLKDPSSEACSYYAAILQNLFFATLNTEMDKPGQKASRRFIEEGDGQRSDDHMIHTFWRHASQLRDPKALAGLLRNAPFLNGGLFECLDDRVQKGNSPYTMEVRIDGFSNDPKKQPRLPNFLFFGQDRIEDLSTAYGDASRNRETVRPLLSILHHYNFTLTENTPFEQEVALDPELLGHVFENLLAAYNPETGTIARKATGSFYTPREIVDYMVDEALIAHLKMKLAANQPSADNVEERLRHLFAYNDEPHQFSAKGVDVLIDAIDHLKALDPAVGSGAFPMGILHKLVFILGKLDPRNEQWEQRQIQRVRNAIATAEKIEDAGIRERTVKELEQQIIGIEESFKRNELDYGRKLYLIENCLFGVDIQSIAVQIAKMRFFISLIVDQRVHSSTPNLGVRPLPNLETKFVAANTLIGIEKRRQMLLRNPQIDAKEAELRRVREKHFTARTLSSKAKCREQDKKLRGEIAELLRSDGWGDKTAKQLSQWDPYDQNASAPFFDPEWMFGMQVGFNIVLGNPPYVFGGNKGISREEKNVYKRLYDSGSKKINLFALFIERGSQLLQSQGTLTYILPNTLLRVTSYSNTRRFILENLEVREIVDLDVGVFDGVTASTVVISLQGVPPGPQAVVRVKRGCEDTVPSRIPQKQWKGRGCVFDIFSSGADRGLMHKLSQGSTPLGELCSRIRFGVVISGNFADVVSDKKPHSKWKPFLEGDEIGPFCTRYRGRFLLYDKDLLHRSRTPDIFETKKIMIQRITGGDTPLKATLDEDHFYNKESILNLILSSDDVSYEYILGLLNSRLVNWLYKRRFTNASKLTVNLSKEYVGQIPVKTVDKRRQESVAKVVRSILSAKRKSEDADTSREECQLNAAIYELYGLTPDEIKIVEGEEETRKK